MKFTRAQVGFAFLLGSATAYNTWPAEQRAKVLGHYEPAVTLAVVVVLQGIIAVDHLFKRPHGEPQEGGK